MCINEGRESEENDIKVQEYADINPITCRDYPDVDVIRVGNIYYMVSTTMYFMPGCEILRSYDLVKWEHAAYVFDRLDSTTAQCLKNGENIYGQGMWAASFRYHDGTFYICFVANDTHKTYLYRAENIQGPWRKSYIEGFYHDNSVLFDDDGRIYIVYGNRNIHITELNSELTGPKIGGIDKVIIHDVPEAMLGYEGSHFYKINGKYYIFLIHIPKSTGLRTESCFVADSPDGVYSGRDVCDDTRDYCGMGVAQGGIVDTPSHRWYAMLFQDSGAVGRIPVLIPMTWEKDMPVLGDNGRIPERFSIEECRSGYAYSPLTCSDDFRLTDKFNKEKYGCFGFRSCWQFNHEPNMNLIIRKPEEGIFFIKTENICKNLVQTRNILTQRTIYPGCSAEVTLNYSDLCEGDYAGLCLLESNYAFIGITRRKDEFFLTVQKRSISGNSIWGLRNDNEVAEECETVKIDGSTIILRVDADFTMMKDEGLFSYRDKVGVLHSIYKPVKLKFMLDHFTGVRIGLFMFSTVKAGGKAGFSDFKLTDA